MKPMDLTQYDKKRGFFSGKQTNEVGVGTWDDNDMQLVSDALVAEHNAGKHIVSMSTYEFEQFFGVPYVAPIPSAGVPGQEEQFGAAMRYAHIARPGSQIYFFTDDEVAAIQAGAGFLAQPADVEFFDPNSGFFETDNAALGKGVNAALAARPGAKMYLFTDADIAKFNGRDIITAKGL
jgi:hypothetical protein